MDEDNTISSSNNKDNTKFLLIGFSIVMWVIIALGFFYGYMGGEKVYGDDVIDLYYFHTTDCTDCYEIENLFEDLDEDILNLRVNNIELIDSNSINQYKSLAAKFEDLNSNGLPSGTSSLTFLGEGYLLGYSQEDSKRKLMELIMEEQKKIDAKWNDKTMTKTTMSS